MSNEPINNPEILTEVAMRSRKANRRTLKGCVTRLEGVQGDIRNVGMQYAEVNPVVFKALHTYHDVLDEMKKGLDRAGNAL